jgi:hypothetical protein
LSSLPPSKNKPSAIARQPRFSALEVKSACGIAAGLAPLRIGVYGDIEREGAMSWTKPAFEEIKMDAEAKSYSDGITW